MAARAGALLDDNLTRVIVETLTAFGVELLDQRPFFGDWLGGSRLLLAPRADRGRVGGRPARPDASRA